MKHYFLLLLLAAPLLYLQAQPDKKPAKPATSSSPQPDMNKMLEEAMKAEGMSKEEMEQMKKYMQNIMPGMNEMNAKTADYPEFSNNSQLIPKKDAARMSNMSKKALAKTEVGSYANNLFTKLMTKGDPAEIAIVKKVISMTPKAADLGTAAVLAMLQGHSQAAMALSCKAVTADPSNFNWQNNMAALLTSYGYPEQAMPLLRKLQNDLPVNSTVLNNIGQAWLGLGELDSAKRFFSFAARANPLHPEAKLCGGLMEELKGDPVKATREYIESLENSPNHFTDKVLKNHDKNYNPRDLDFEKIKKLIAIYEYFPANWMPEIPILTNDVRHYNEDYATKKAYAQMISDFKNKVQAQSDLLSAELEALSKKDEEVFVKEMMSATQKGLSFMSKPATVVLGVLSSYQVKWQMDNAEELKGMISWKAELIKNKRTEIDAIYKQIRDSRGLKCENFKARLDQLENDFLRTVNTRMRAYMMQKTEEFRQWLNAWCTWNWYVSGNTKNIVLVQDMGFTAYMAELYGGIVDVMETLPEHCNPQTRDVVRTFTAPEIPNFTCPAVVSIPAGPEWQQIVAGAKNFDNNGYGIKQSSQPVPNVSVATAGGKTVAQPGAHPFYKTANGGITPGGADVEAAMDKGLMNAFRRVNGKKTSSVPTDEQVGDAIDKGLSDAMKRMQERRKQGVLGDDDELVPLPKIPANNNDDDDELVPLSKIPLEYLEPLDRKIVIRQKLLKELMDKMLTADCSGVKSSKDILREQLDRMNKKIRELEAYNNMMDEIKRLENEIAQKEADAAKREAMNKKIADFQKSADELDRYEEMNDFLKKAEQFGKEMDAMDEKKSFRDHMAKIQQMVDEMDATPAFVKDIQTNGLQPSISSGLQVPGTFTPNKTLFQ